VAEPSPIQGKKSMFAKPAKPKKDEAVLQKLPPTKVAAKSRARFNRFAAGAIDFLSQLNSKFCRL
jgi:hypothetical protein